MRPRVERGTRTPNAEAPPLQGGALPIRRSPRDYSVSDRPHPLPVVMPQPLSAALLCWSRRTLSLLFRLGRDQRCIPGDQTLLPEDSNPNLQSQNLASCRWTREHRSSVVVGHLTSSSRGSARHRSACLHDPCCSRTDDQRRADTSRDTARPSALPYRPPG